MKEKINWNFHNSHFIRWLTQSKSEATLHLNWGYVIGFFHVIIIFYDSCNEIKGSWKKPEQRGKFPLLSLYVCVAFSQSFFSLMNFTDGEKKTSQFKKKLIITRIIYDAVAPVPY